MTKRIFIVKSVVIGVSVVVIGFLGINAFLTKDLSLPPYQKVALQWTPQNWKTKDWSWFYHATQGGALDLVIPYTWFLALEQPTLSLKAQPRLADSTYLERMGFLHDAKSADNPDGLPVGFARTAGYHNPITGQSESVIGLTCAACHTGQLNYQGKGIRIDGGAALVNLDKLRKALGVSLLLTRYDPLRFERFCKHVLGDQASAQDRSHLKEDLGKLVDAGKKLKNRDESLKLFPVEEGFGRLDALGRIGNFVFGSELSEANLLPADAPVSFPHIWNASWFEWVQYNGSIKQPMIRNAGEAMGVFARVDLTSETQNRFTSSVDVKSLHQIENRLRGPNVFQAKSEPKFRGLDSPKWPEGVFGKINQVKANQGHGLYAQYCQVCHMASASTPEFFSDKYWSTADQHGNRYLKVNMVNLAEIGTDGTTAINWYKAVVNLGTLGSALKADINQTANPFLGVGSIGAVMPAGVALPLIVQKTVENRYKQLGIPQEQWDEMNGNRPNEVRAPLAYMARPLNGVWATPPFLHNGSVHSIYQLLLPATQRDKTFYLGNKEYDPVHLGYQTQALEGGFLLDTSKQGNYNTGHDFSASKLDWPMIVAKKNFTPGVIGPELNEEERMAIIEFLKTF